MSDYEVSPEARQEIWDIWKYIAGDDETMRSQLTDGY